MEKYLVQIKEDNGKYSGRFGYTPDKEPIKNSNCIRFFSKEGKYPYQYNCPAERIIYLKES